jgi:hypothetical protein
MELPMKVEPAPLLRPWSRSAKQIILFLLFSSDALAKNALIEVVNHPTGRHGFDIIDPNQRSRGIIRHARDFLHTSLPSP